MRWEIVVVLNPEKRAGVTIKTPICHHRLQLTQSATHPPGSAQGSFLSALPLRKESLATPDFYRIFRKLHISGRSVAFFFPYSRRNEFIGCFWKWASGAKLRLYEGVHGQPMGVYLRISQTHEWFWQNCPYFILTLSPSSSYRGKKKWRFSDVNNSFQVSDRAWMRDRQFGAKSHVLNHPTPSDYGSSLH